MSNHKYLRKVITNKPGKWLDIGLTNLAAEMTLEELQVLLPLVTKEVIAQREARIVRLTELAAPQVIMDNEYKMLEHAKAGKDSRIAILRRAIKKVS